MTTGKKVIRSRREINQNDQQPLPTQLSLDELPEEEDVADGTTDTKQEEVMEEGIGSEEQLIENGPPASDTPISNHSTLRAELNESLSKNEEQPPPQASRRLFWYISCAVAAVVIGIIIAYIVINKRE